MKRILNIIIILTLSQCFNTSAQKKYVLEIKTDSVDITPLLLKKLTPFKETFATEKERSDQLQSVILGLYDKGFLASSIDSIKQDSLRLTAFLHIGTQYKWAYLKPGNIDEDAINAADYQRKTFTNTPFSYKKVSTIIQRLLTYYENHGYPFILIRLDSLNITDESSITANLYAEKKKLVKIDSISIKGNPKISEQFIYTYIGIKPGDLYNESQVTRVSTRIRELPFVAETRSPEVLFTEKHTKLTLFLEPKKANQIDGVLGFLPDEETGKIQITGQAHPILRNSFGKGEIIDLDWKKLQQNTHDLKVKFNYPFLFSTQFGADLNLRIFRKDTLYNEVIKNAGIQYLLQRGNFFKVFIDNRTSTLLSSKGLENITVLPSYADVNTTLYGVGLRTEKVDYRLNPTKGYRLQLSVAAGNKKVEKNPRLNDQVYKDIKLSSAQYTAEGIFDLYLPIRKRTVINFSNKSGFLENSNTFQNELFRIGGLRTLRGFDEESINASIYNIATLEYRYLLERNSYLYVFADGAYYENKSISFTGARYDTPFGFGLGMSFETKAGIFSINYALGKQFDNPIYLRSAKVHFGIITVL